MTTQLILVSHALTQWNVEGRIQGHTDVPLNPQGREMAERLARHLAPETIHAVYTSDLKRAIQTAAPTAEQKSLGIQKDIRLREGRIITQERSDIYPTLPFPMEVETRTDLYTRMTQALTQICLSHDGQTVLVVSHAGSLDIFITALLETSGKNRLNYQGVRMALNRFTYESGIFQCLSLNEADFFKMTPSLPQSRIQGMCK